MALVASCSILLICIPGFIIGLEVSINLTDVRAQVEPEFLSFAIDAVQLSPPKWQTFDFKYMSNLFFLRYVILYNTSGSSSVGCNIKLMI